jgi:hypothetical protein
MIDGDLTPGRGAQPPVAVPPDVLELCLVFQIGRAGGGGAPSVLRVQRPVRRWWRLYGLAVASALVEELAGRYLGVTKSRKVGRAHALEEAGPLRLRRRLPLLPPVVRPVVLLTSHHACRHNILAAVLL